MIVAFAAKGTSLPFRIRTSFCVDLTMNVALTPHDANQLNFIWSLLYNCLSIPLAAGVFYPFFRTRLPPTVAALAMALSSLSVVASSLALHLYRPPKVSVPFNSKTNNKIDIDVHTDIESQAAPLLGQNF